MNTTIIAAGSATITDLPPARQLRRSGDDKMLAPVAWIAAAGIAPAKS